VGNLPSPPLSKLGAFLAKWGGPPDRAAGQGLPG
jgi:hypothetical protein